ncbi:STELLO glycosyltransferase family protein [Caulobacter sp. S45]|uniref:STELLO glycosyltransferase family protein n=1 Tax=Caulobacter sp. S45 TaxID=1641861 RepID=UPI00157762DC|nr:STELLO glycosyltransferase family protein [Caulobacter sp. S45]
MNGDCCIVVTTINAPTQAMLELAKGASDHDAHFIVIGDSKSPKDFRLPGSTYLDVEAQRATPFGYAALCPTRHYARKNIGYLLAATRNAQVIVETDDDNIPVEGFWTPRSRSCEAAEVRDAGWCNVYRYFSDTNIWPRGLPLNELARPAASLSPVSSFECPIQQGLADLNPDVDAIYRLVLPLPVSFQKRQPIALAPGVWCPFNSQNTTFFREAFPLLYLPYHCSFRMTDIWRSFIAQRLGWEAGWRVMFHNSTVYQERNEHDLMRDFAEEIPGYLNNERIRKSLEDADFRSGVDALWDNLLKAYELLIGLEVVGAEESQLVSAWVEDMTKATS